MKVFGGMNAFIRFLGLLTVVSPKFGTSALFGSFCKTVQGVVPNNNSFAWYVPLFVSGTSANLNAEVSAELYVALVPNCNLMHWSSNKYNIVFGASGNSGTFISEIRSGSILQFNSTPTILNAAAYVPLWVSWFGGVISSGKGPVVGVNTVISYADPSPTPINCLLIGGNRFIGYAIVTYCYQPRIFDMTSPIDQPTIANVVATELDCGRACDDDIQCQGYAVNRRHVTPLGQSSCMIYYSISGLQFDPDHVLYVVGNYTLLKM